MAFTPTRNRIKAAAAKIEATYGTDPVIAGATDGFNMIDTPAPWNAQVDRTEFRNHGASFTRQKDVLGARVGVLNFKYMLQGSGTAGTVMQGISPVFQSCGLAETVSAGVSVTYKPAAVTALKSTATKFERNGATHAALGCYGNLVIACDRAGAATVCTYSGMGLYQVPVLGSIASWGVGTTGVNRAQPNLSLALTLANGVDTWTTPTVQSYSIDLGNQITRIPDANSATGMKVLLFADRNPTMHIVLCIDLDTPGAGAGIQFNELYIDWLASTTHNISFALGATAGNINTFTATQAQLIDAQQQEGDGFGTIDLWYKLQNSVNESDFQLVQT